MGGFGFGFLSASLQMLCDRLASPEVAALFQGHKDSAGLLKQLTSTLFSIRAVMDDAEQKQIASASVQVWLKKLEDAVLDADDLLDEIVTEAMRLRREMIEAERPRPRSLVRRFIISTSLKPYGKEMRSKIKAISERIDVIATERLLFGLTESVRGVENDGVLKASMRSSTTSLVNEAMVYGKEKDKEEIVKWLLSDDTGSDRDDQISVISIVGMGGLGKTTLAQFVYNESRVSKRFDIKAWVCVTDNFNIRLVTKTILEQVTSQISESNDLNLLQIRLYESLAGKKFLLFLDDVWNENYHEWEMLRTSFRSAAIGSKIIVTTRNERVASIMSSWRIFHLTTLSDEDCWSIIARLAFSYENHSANPELEAIGRQLASKCMGLPLAARALGGLLRYKRTAGEWNAILKSNFWDMLDYGNSTVLAGLGLSYYHLPAHLKRCFAYCSMFPSDYNFEKEKLILLWMAEGFLQQPRGKEMEEVGDEYFNDLLSRNFFLQSNGSKSHFKMHDIMNDLAQSVSGDLCFRLDGYKAYEMSESVRHLSYSRGKNDTLEKFEVIYRAKFLRTFLQINSRLDHESCRLSNDVLQYLLKRLQLVRVLSLPYYQITELPDSIGNLKHLRYLDLSHNALTRLPESVSTLCYLQTLILTNCCSLATLPQSIGKQISLCHLFISGTSLYEMPLQMSRLTNLQTLTNFVVGQEGSRIRELGGLLNLKGTLSISELQNVVNATDASYAKLKEKRYLDELQLEWSSDKKDTQSQNERELLENLEPSRELEKLTIRFYEGTTFPDWLGHSSFSKIVFLCLRDCKNCSSLPPLGQLPYLKDLLIERMSGVSSIGHEFYGNNLYSHHPFPSLKTLRFEGMSEWEQWISLELEGVEFPCLLELYVRECPKLEGSLPKHLPSLTRLEIFECQQLKPSFLRIPDTCELLLHDNNKLLLKHDKLPLRIDDDSVSQLSSHMTEISNLTYEAASQSSSEKIRYDVASQSFLHITEAPAHQPDDPIKSSFSQDGVQHLTSSGSFKVSDIARLGELPTGLHSLRIEGCDTLESLPIEIFNLNPFLQHFYIIDCSSFKSFPQGHQPTAVKALYIRNCRKLEFLPTAMMSNVFALLENLCIGSSCDSLRYFPINLFPKLRILCLWDCQYLESIFIWEGLQNDSKSLDALEIRDCPNLASFPKEGLPTPNLTSIIFSNCKNMKSLPRRMHKLIGLRSLFINKCPELESLPAGGLPSSLNSLCIAFCDKITPRKEWNLDRLDCLSHFEIEGGCKDMESFPEEGLLPTNLNSLRISTLLSLKFLDNKGLQQLSSLETLEINCCKRLRSLPEGGLPSSLSFLSIRECSLLKPKLQYKKGKDWFKIAHIRHIHIDEEESREQV